MNKMKKYLKPYYKRMVLGFIIKFTGTIMDLLLPWILAYLLDTVVPLEDVSLIVIWGLMMIICSVIAIIGNVVANRMASKVARDVTEEIRHDLFVRVSNLSSSQIDDYTLPTLISRMTTDTYNVHQVIGMMQRLGVRAPILLLGGLMVTFTLEPMMTLVLVATLPFITFVVYYVSKKGIPLFSKLQSSVDRMVRIVREDSSGIRVIKALSKTDYEKRRFEVVNEELVANETKANTTMSITNPMMNLFLNLGLVGVIIVGAYRVDGGFTQPGKIISFLSYFTIILNAMLMVTRMFVMYSRGIASANRIEEVLNTPADLIVGASDYQESPAHIVFDDVCFSYHHGREQVSHISFELKQGETLGIIGATGSGKSSLIQLLMRLYEVKSGEIRINGENVKNIPEDKLHTMFGVVFQNDILFADTIAENIAFGRDVSDQQIKNAASHAQAEAFIDSIAEGYKHSLTSKGTNLSGGQRQRLLIARALAGHPEILVLDDSSSALDYKTDANLRKALGNHFNETTTIIVAQRISAIMHADHIMVLEAGQTIGYGTHEELLKSCSTYQEISKIQMGGGII